MLSVCDRYCIDRAKAQCVQTLPDPYQYLLGTSRRYYDWVSTGQCSDQDRLQINHQRQGQAIERRSMCPSTRAPCKVPERKSCRPVAHTPVARLGSLILKRDSRQYDVSAATFLILWAWQKLLRTGNGMPAGTIPATVKAEHSVT
jgi:hypothetical protein